MPVPSQTTPYPSHSKGTHYGGCRRLRGQGLTEATRIFALHWVEATLPPPGRMAWPFPGVTGNWKIRRPDGPFLQACGPRSPRRPPPPARVDHQGAGETRRPARHEEGPAGLAPAHG